MEKQKKNKEKERKIAMGCSIGCVGFIILLILGFIISQFFFKGNEDVKQKEIEGIDVEMVIDSNNKVLDEAIIRATITNSTDKTYSGKVSLFHSSFKGWDIDVKSLPPGKQVTREIKEKYVKHPDDEFRYSAAGKLEDKKYKSKIKYTAKESETKGSLNVQMDEVSKENVIEVMKELYSIHGENLINVSFFDNSVNINSLDFNVDSPIASYFGTKAGKTISIGNDTLDFEP